MAKRILPPNLNLINAKRKLNQHSKKPFDENRLKIKNRLTRALNEGVKQEKLKNTRVNVTATKPERLVKEILKKHGIKFKQEFELMGKFFDFKLEIDGVEILLEVDGNYWHGKNADELNLQQTKQRIEDFYKDCICVVLQIPLIRVWDDEINERELIKEIERCKELRLSGNFHA